MEKEGEKNSILSRVPHGEGKGKKRKEERSQGTIVNRLFPPTMSDWREVVKTEKEGAQSKTGPSTDKTEELKKEKKKGEMQLGSIA